MKKTCNTSGLLQGAASVFSLRRFICNHMIQASKFSFFLLNLHYTCWWVTSALHTHTHIHVTCSIQHTALVPVTQSANYPIHIMVPPSKVTARTSTARRHALIDTWLWMGGRCSGYTDQMIQCHYADQVNKYCTIHSISNWCQHKIYNLSDYANIM